MKATTPEESNLWGKYILLMCNSDNRTGYVCSVIPKSVTQVTLISKLMNEKQPECFASYAGVGS